MSEPSPPGHLSHQGGDRPFRPTRIIPCPGPRELARPLTPRHHARRFIVALAAIIATGTGFLMLPWATESSRATDPFDALFTAVSATCVTGLVTVDTADHWSFLGELVILILIQIGGLGFMVGASLLLQILRHEVGLRETLLMRDGGATLSVREAIDLSRKVVRFTLLVEGAGAALLTARFALDMPLHLALWHGIFHAVSAFCNAGFDLQGDFVSLAPYQGSLWVNATIMTLIQAGALSYIFVSELVARRRWTRLSLDSKLILIVNTLLLAGGTLVFLGVEWSRALADVPTWARFHTSLFQSVAARTAGYATVEVGDFQTVTLFFWVLLMGIGGASGSTAGGVKLTTVGVVAVAVTSTLRGQLEPQLFGRRLPIALVFRSIAIIVLFVAIHFIATVSLALTEDWLAGAEVGFLDLMFEAMSALATVGITTGITPALSDPGKLVLCVTMFIGRLGPLTAAFALQRRQARAAYRFPETSVRIG
ncbi:MAG: potassium transporter TrkG [Thermomicrobiales bacterium]